MSFKKTLRWFVLAGIFLTLLTPLIVSGGLFFPFITGKAFFFRIIVEVVAVLWIVLALLDREYAPRKSWIFGTVALLTVVSFVANILGENPYKAFWSNFERMEGWVTVAHLFLYFIVLATVVAKEKLWDRFFQTSLAVSIIASLWALGQVAEKGISIRADASLGNPIYLAIYLFFHIFISLYFIFRDEKRVFRDPLHYVYGAILVIEFFALLFTQTRGTMLGLVAGIFIASIVLAFGEKKNVILKRSAIGLIIAVVLAGVSFYGARNTAFVKENPTLSRFASVFTEIEKIGNPGEKKLARYYIWDMALQGFQERPVLGWGQEGFNFVFNKYYDPNLYDQEQWFDRTHNVFLDWLIAGGLVGLVAYLGLFGAILFYLWRPKGRAVFALTERALWTGLLVGYAVHNIFVFDNLISYLVFFTILAYVHGKVTDGEGTSVVHYRLPDKDVVLGGIVPVLAVVLVFGLYYVNYKPLRAASTLVDALQPHYATSSVGGQRALDPMQNLELYKKVIALHTLGSSEAREYIMQSAVGLNKPEVPEVIRSAFFTFAKEELDKQLIQTPNDTRYLIFMGSFLDAYRMYDVAWPYLLRAHESSPMKQTVSFELVGNLLNRRLYADALALAKSTFESQTGNDQARKLYAMTAIYAKDFSLASRILKEGYGTDLVYDDQIILAYIRSGMLGKALQIAFAHAEANPNDIQAQLVPVSVYREIGDIDAAVSWIRKLETRFPQYKDQLEGFINDLVK